MTRQNALVLLWKRLLGLLLLILALCLVVLAFGEDARTGILVFLIGNIGGYVGFHKNLGDMKDEELVELAGSWWSIVVPSFVGGVLALVLYLLFLSGIISGDLFPKFEERTPPKQDVGAILDQYAVGMASYAKLFFWSFVAGFNQKYVVNIIESMKTK